MVINLLYIYILTITSYYMNKNCLCSNLIKSISYKTVINISSLHKNDSIFFESYRSLDNNVITSLGSGFLVDEVGHIVTNYHVIEHSRKINISFTGKKNFFYSAKIVGYDKKTDIALLKIDVNYKVPFLRFANSDLIKLGQPVFTIGNALGFEGSVTTGIISHKNRFLGNEYNEIFIQTDAAINKGNSGGAMINLQGLVIGVNTIIVSSSGGNIGIGFAIPANTIKIIILEILRSGNVYRMWLGLSFQNINNHTIVSDISINSPIYKIGITLGDTIYSINNTKIRNYNSILKIMLYSNFKIYKISVIRKRAFISFNVNSFCTHVKNSYVSNIVSEPDSLVYMGIHLIEMDTNIKDYYNIQDNKGLFIIKVSTKSNAYIEGVRVGDIIQYINSKKINTLNDVIKNIRFKNGTNYFLVKRDKVNFFVSI